jgi:pimeloyl-ACP methyl ester carboxylesterase
MDTIINIIFCVFLFIGFVIFSGFFWQWFYSAPTHQDETYYFEASDGWPLALHHYRSEKPQGFPVVLCHGLSSNRYVFDLPDAPSLAKYLAEHGRDIWVAELRGSGMSASPGLYKSDVSYKWNFDDHLEKDVPAIIAQVLKLTNASKIHWVGHSMGGMLVLAHLAQTDDLPVASATAVGSPTDFSKMKLKLGNLIVRFRTYFEWMPFSPLPFFGRFLTPFVPYLPDKYFTIFNPENMNHSVARKTIALASQLVTSHKIWLQFGNFVQSGRFASADNRLYVDGLGGSQVPVMVIAGGRDIMSPEASVTSVCNGPHAPANIECMVLSRENGFSADYGHLDLMVGIRAREEVFPIIENWISTTEPDLNGKTESI